MHGYAHGDVVAVHIVALQPNGVATRPARVKHRCMVRANDEVVVVGEGQVLLKRSLLVHIVPARTRNELISLGTDQVGEGRERRTHTRP